MLDRTPKLLALRATPTRFFLALSSPAIVCSSAAQREIHTHTSPYRNEGEREEV